jgi:hypothetical protein
MLYSYDKKKLNVNGIVIAFEGNVDKVIVIDDILIVLIYGDKQIEEIGEDIFYRNVCAVDAKGNILWRIQSISDMETNNGGKLYGVYSNIFIDEKGRLIAYNGAGYDFRVNLKNGKIRDNSNGRPW